MRKIPLEEIDELELRTLKEEVIRKLPLIKIGMNSGFLEKAIEGVNEIVDLHPSRWIEGVSSAYLNVCEQLKSSVPNVQPTLYHADLLWSYVCIVSYYLYSGYDTWNKHIQTQMESKIRNKVLYSDIDLGKALIDSVKEKICALEQELELETEPETASKPNKESAVNSQYIAELETRLAEKDEEIERLNARIKELEEQLNVVHLSFIETEGKNPNSIKWAYNDIKKAIGSPAEMAECLHSLQVQGILKNQERYGKLKKIKKIYDELEETYHFEWTYPALCRALTRLKTK